ncbi:hypothetical protein WP2S18C03_02620 [Aeromonas veronii]|nr:hypothetical protein WP2S18C03_02620 [Aeromonas veronii]
MATVLYLSGFCNLRLNMMNSENQWFRSRGYLHFDSPVKLRKACQIVKSPLNVAQHAFFPLIKYNIQSLKISIDKDGNVQKKIKTRPISYASHIDSHIYSYYAELLSDLYEKALSESQLEESVLAFRSLGKSANSTSKCDTRLCRLTVLFEYLDRLPESETFPRS